MARNLNITDSEYTLVHLWMKQMYGKPQHCENCGITEKRMYHWANISGTYQRERTDWLRLCVPCHKRHDVKALGGKIKARLPKEQPSKLCTECGVQFFKRPRFSTKQWQAQYLCGKDCKAKVVGRLKTGVGQTAETKALKSQKLRERWAMDEVWRTRMTTMMIGNQYARKHSKI